MSVELNLGAAFETAQKGCYRAAVFMGLGHNAATSSELRDYKLDGASRLQLLPDNASGAQIIEWKREFAKWIVASGFRELTEFYALFLDQCFEALLLVSGAYCAKTHEKFHRKGLAEKIEVMRVTHGITCKSPDALASITAVRNCLVHRAGLVAANDRLEDGCLVLRWRGLQFGMTATDGVQQVMPDLSAPNPTWNSQTCGGDVWVCWAAKERKFSIGSEVILTPDVIQEVIYFALISAKEYVAAIEERARQLGRLRE